VRAGPDAHGSLTPTGARDDDHAAAAVDRHERLSSGRCHVMWRRADACASDDAPGGVIDPDERAAAVVGHPQAAFAEGEVMGLGTDPKGAQAPA
jgi:hypothetical protein